MTNRLLLSLLFFSVTVALAACTADTDAPEPPANQIETHQGSGVVKTITPSQAFVNIDHEDIPGFMDAMAMFFAVRDSSVLDGISVSDSVKFTLEIEDGNVTIIEMETIGR